MLSPHAAGNLLLCQFVFRHRQCHLDDLVHIVVLVLAQTAAEDDARLSIGQLLVCSVERTVLLVVDGVVRLIALLPLGAVLAADDRFGLGSELKVLVLDDAGVGSFRIGIDKYYASQKKGDVEGK